MEKEQQPDMHSESLSQQHDKTEKIDHQLKLRIEQGLRKKKQLDIKAQQTGMSKNQLKKLQKKQKWQEQKMIKRKEKRQKQRERKKQNKQNQKQSQQQHLDNNNKQQQNNQNNQNNIIVDLSNPQIELTRKRKDEYQQKMKDNLKVVIDMQFYDQMVEKQLNSLVKQLSYCHAINRKMPKPFHYILTSMTEQRIKFVDDKYNGKKWGIQLLQQDLTAAFNPQDMVYLTGDAQEEMQEFDQNKIYVIGGIVDHNRLKNITYDFAKNHNIEIKRLPFNNIKLKTNVHLAVNHVWEWMLRKYNGESWDQSLSKVLPERKIIKIQ